MIIAIDTVKQSITISGKQDLFLIAEIIGMLGTSNELADYRIEVEPEKLLGFSVSAGSVTVT